MQPANNRLPILICGVNGQLGKLVLTECLNRNELLVNVLLRSPHKCTDLCQEVKNHGGKCIEADITKPETLKGVTKGIHTVISCLDGDEKVLIDGQNTLLQDAISNGVKRFVPSDFTFDVRKITEKDHPTLTNKLRFRKKVMDSPVKGLFVHCGTFMETFTEHYENGLTFWETMDQKLAMTSVEDVARMLALILTKPDRVGDFSIAGDQLTLNEIVNRYNTIRNTKVPVLKLGTKQDLIKAIEIARSKGDEKTSHILGYQLMIVDGKATLTDLNNNEVPQIKPVTWEQFIKDHPHLKLGETLTEEQQKQFAMKLGQGVSKIESIFTK